MINPTKKIEQLDIVKFDNLTHFRVDLVNFLKIFVSMILLFHLISCAPHAKFTPAERDAISAGEKSLVLLRIKCLIDGKEFYDPFASTNINSLIIFGLGTFDTIGEPREVLKIRCLSELSCREGWTYFLLFPGVYYLAVAGPVTNAAGVAQNMLDRVPRWQIEVPENAKLIYVGTLLLEGTAPYYRDNTIKPVHRGQGFVQDEQDLGKQLLTEHIPEAGEMQTILMQRWHRGDPIILRTPQQ